MGTRGLAEYFVVKYAGPDNLSEDTSFGVPINGDKVRVLKDGIQNIYSKIEENLTTQPLFDKLNVTLVDDPQWNDVHKWIMNLVNYVNDHNLKDCFTYSVRLTNKLVLMRRYIADKRKDIEFGERFTLQDAVRRIGDHIWKQAKHILNLHDLKGLLIRIPEVERILGLLSVPPAWDFGDHGDKWEVDEDGVMQQVPGGNHLKNPSEPYQAPIMQRYDNSLHQTTKQWELNAEMAAARKALGPYAPDEELTAWILRKRKDHHNEIARKSVEKKKKENAAGTAAQQELGGHADRGQVLALLKDKEEKTKKIIEYLKPVIKANGTRATDQTLLSLINNKINADMNSDNSPRYSHGTEMDISNDDLLDAIRKYKAANAKMHADKAKGK